MFEVKWTTGAELSYQKTLTYWNERNKSPLYSLKIIDAVDEILLELQKNPFFLSKYHEKYNLYQKLFLKNKFSLFYEIIENEKKIRIKHFRSNSQEPL